MKKLLAYLLGLGAIAVMFFSMTAAQAKACGWGGGCHRNIGCNRCGYDNYPYMGYNGYWW
jgi:hypothetical protein